MADLPRSIGDYNYRVIKEFKPTNMSLLALAEEVQANGNSRQVVLKIARMQLLDSGTTRTSYAKANQLAMENEERRLRAIEHPNVIRLLPIAEKSPRRVPIYRARALVPGSIEQPWFIVSEYLPGGSLEDYARSPSVHSVRLSVEILIQLARTLDYLHSQGHVHLDLKPNNVLFRALPNGPFLTEQNKPIVIDFGITRSPGDVGFVQGTTPWMAPENCIAKPEKKQIVTGPAMDIYALGLIMYFILAREKFPARDSRFNFSKPLQLSSSIFSNDRTVSRQQQISILAKLNDLLARATATDSQRRPTALAFAQELERVLAEIPVTEAKSSRLWYGLASAVVSGLLLLLFWLRLSPGRPPSEQLPKDSSTVTVTEPAVETAWAVADTPPPTATPNDLATPTSVAMAGNQNPPTPSPTLVSPTATPQPTVTPTASATASPTATFTPTKAPTPTDTPTRGPTTVPVGPTTAVPPSPTSTTRPTRPPTTVPVSLSTATPTSTLGPIGPTPTSGLQPTATQGTRRVDLLEPPDNISASGTVVFSWSPRFTLADGEAFEVIFWKPGQDPWSDGFGIKDMGIYTSVSTDLGELSRQRSEQFGPGDYWWTVFVVTKKESGEYIRLVQASAPRRLVFR